MSTKYFTLLVRHETHAPAPWGIEFGDYSRSEVNAERSHYCSCYEHPKRLTHIICTGESQHEIQAAVIKLNEELGFIPAIR